MKMLLNSIQNLKGFAISRPPLVIFTICLASFGIATLALSFYLKDGPIRNPDIKDWNTVMEQVSIWNLCIETGFNSHKKPGTVARDTLPLGKTYMNIASSLIGTTSTTKPPIQTVSVFLKAKFSYEIAQLSPKTEFLHSYFSLKDLGFKDIDSKEKVSYIIDLGHTNSFKNCTVGGYCEAVDVCVTFIGRTQVLPRTKESRTCNVRNPKQGYATFILIDMSKEPNELATPCSGIVVDHEFIHDPFLDEILSYSEQTLINIHLTYTSYFLFVMVMTILCYAIVKGQRTPKQQGFDKVSNV